MKLRRVGGSIKDREREGPEGTLPNSPCSGYELPLRFSCSSVAFCSTPSLSTMPYVLRLSLLLKSDVILPNKTNWRDVESDLIVFCTFRPPLLDSEKFLRIMNLLAYIHESSSNSCEVLRLLLRTIVENFLNDVDMREEHATTAVA